MRSSSWQRGPLCLERSRRKFSPRSECRPSELCCYETVSSVPNLQDCIQIVDVTAQVHCTSCELTPRPSVCAHHAPTCSSSTSILLLLNSLHLTLTVLSVSTFHEDPCRRALLTLGRSPRSHSRMPASSFSLFIRESVFDTSTDPIHRTFGPDIGRTS